LDVLRSPLLLLKSGIIYLPLLKYLYHLTPSNVTSKHTILPLHNFFTTPHLWFNFPLTLVRYQIFYITIHFHVLTTAPLNDLMTVHLFRAPTFCVKQAIPVCLEAAPLFTVCSCNVMSTAPLEKKCLVRLTESAPASKFVRIPGCVASTFSKLGWYRDIERA